MGMKKATPELLMGIRPGLKIRVKDGRTLTVRGSYMSPTGLVFRTREGDGLVEQNVPIGHIEEVEDASGQG